VSETETHSALAQIKALRSYIDGVLKRVEFVAVNPEGYGGLDLNDTEQAMIVRRFNRLGSTLRRLRYDLFPDAMHFGKSHVSLRDDLQEMRSELTYWIETLEHVLEHSAISTSAGHDASDDYSRTNAPFSQEEQRLLAE
jgi:hypothetical protein